MTHDHDTRPGHDHGATPDPASAAHSRDRALRIGIGGPVGSGKTALVAALCRNLRDDVSTSPW